jgi:hypothetical protein
LSGPAIWIAEVNDGQVAVWEVCDDNPEQRLKLGLIRQCSAQGLGSAAVADGFARHRR